MTLNSKEENSSDFCLDFVQEFGLWVQAASTGTETGDNCNEPWNKLCPCYTFIILQILREYIERDRSRTCIRLILATTSSISLLPQLLLKSKKEQDRRKEGAVKTE